MQLKLRRSQRESGIVSKSAIFCLDARAELGDQERRDLTRYKLYDQVIYNSEAAKHHLHKVAGSDTGTASGLLKGAMHLALARMRLNITVKSLERGQHIECKSLEELLAAEEAIMEACRNLRVFLDVAATFNGSEVVVDFTGGEPKSVAQAQRPEPILAPPLPTAISATPALALEGPAAASATSADPAEYDHYEPDQLSPISAIINSIAERTGAEPGAVRMVMALVGIAIVVVIGRALFRV